MVTIQDVALEAGVSSATVSRVINKSQLVSPLTCVRVEAAILKLNYQPNLLGRNLRRSETRMVLVLVQNISNPFYSKVVRGIEEMGRQNGYHVMICNTDSDKEQEVAFLSLLKNQLVDGVIFMTSELTAQELSAIGRDFPVVQCCEYKEDAEVSRVSIDNTGAAYRATKHLINLGHKRIGFISGNERILSARQRKNGYRKAIEEAGFYYDPQLVRYGNYGFKGGYTAAKELLSLNKVPTAVFAISDIMAIGTLKMAKEAGLSIPNGFAVVGFDNTSMASMYDPPLTTISQPRYDLGREAMNLLLKRIHGDILCSQNIILEHDLVIRESTVV